MNLLIALPLGFLLDQLLGDPPSWPHPVRWIGHVISRLEPALRRWFPERVGGVLLLLLTIAIAGLSAWAMLFLAALWHPWAETAIATWLIYWGLAARSLARETELVLEACATEDWPEARRRLSRIVGRDTEQLSPQAIYRACIETVAENTTDGVVAPLLCAALFGPVGLWAYKAISTLDSMVGYRTEKYLYFGWASARADDVANFLPARLAWLLIALRGGRAALRIGWRDGRKHASPNSAWAEAAMAGALGVQLGGPATYGGVPSDKQPLGDPGDPLSLEKGRQAIRLMTRTAWLGLGIVLLLALAWHGADGKGMGAAFLHRVEQFLEGFRRSGAEVDGDPGRAGAKFRSGKRMHGTPLVFRQPRPTIVRVEPLMKPVDQRLEVALGRNAEKCQLAFVPAKGTNGCSC
ncbi:MAG: adenosylcobinamide-phosphate synthase CbiB [Gemmataceae bacterium]|nr:adenosylcobinamide-phosphate synthase CbiB [Gemmataceae bacterium]